MNWRTVLAAAVVAALASPALAQSIGFNASIPVTTTTANAQLTASKATFPVAVIVPAQGTNVEIFYQLGVDNTVAATTSSPAVPPGGICVALGANSWVAAITSTSTATLRITQMSTCPILGHLHGPASPPPSCSNSLNFSQACNSQYLAMLRL